jgi:hypothetical protein
MDIGQLLAKAAEHAIKSLQVGLFSFGFFTLMATLLIVRLRGTKTMKQAMLMGVAAGAVGGVVMGVISLVT